MLTNTVRSMHTSTQIQTEMAIDFDLNIQVEADGEVD